MWEVPMEGSHNCNNETWEEKQAWKTVHISQPENWRLLEP
jgi:hypothetical protein